MSETQPIILKIGGSVITDKDGDLSAKTEVINRLSEEIKKSRVKNLVIVHGGGSFGHPTADKYRIQDGFKSDAQKIGFAETHHVMTVLNGLLMDALIWHEIPAVSVAPSSCGVTENGRIKAFDATIIEMMLKMGFTPVLYGDVILDDVMGFTVLSGDQLISYLAVKLGAKRIVVGTDAGGIYDADPRLVEAAKMYSHLTLEELSKIIGQIGKSASKDVTGGMLGKINELAPAIEKGIPVTMVNVAEPGFLHKALIGEKVEGTVIEKD